ncbi:MAG: hypothetical protein RLZZ142_1237 [Verrucomicrobiota bacterium]|jgi:hypothetical protein
MKTSPLLAAVLCLLVQGAQACSLPVFRFALDRWAPDPFHLQVSAEDATRPEIAKFTRNFSAASALNLEIHSIPEAPSRLLRPDSAPNTPHPLWSGSLTPEFLDSLSQSTARDEIVRRLLRGDSAVFVFVESEDGLADNAAAAALEKRLRFLQQVVALPEIDPSDPSSKPGPGPALQVQFSVLRVPGRHTVTKSGSSSDNLLLSMLAGPKSGLEESTEPWVAAIFGRGRVLGAWPSASFSDEQIEEVALFLAGACSCQVKRQNPGWDLLLHIDWEEALHAQGHHPLPSSSTALQKNASTPASPASPQPETVQIRPRASPPASANASAPNRTDSLRFWAILGGFLGIAAAMLMRKIRSRP